MSTDYCLGKPSESSNLEEQEDNIKIGRKEVSCEDRRRLELGHIPGFSVRSVEPLVLLAQGS